jgi:hypothetical protein
LDLVTELTSAAAHEAELLIKRFALTLSIPHRALHGVKGFLGIIFAFEDRYYAFLLHLSFPLAFGSLS